MNTPNPTNDLENIKPTKKHKRKQLWQDIKPHLTVFTIWFLFALPLNFVITIGLYYQLIAPASYMMMAKILCLIIVNTIVSALIYFSVIWIKYKFKNK